MFHFRRSWVAMVAVGLALVGTGCRPKTAAHKPAVQKPAAVSVDATTDEHAVPPPAPKPRHTTVDRDPKPQKLPPLTVPEVTLSDELRAACLVNVGDTMPDVELVDLDGKPHVLDSLYGPKLTVVCFWTIGTTSRYRRVATAALQDLINEVVDPFGDKGVQVVGINIGDAAEDVRRHVTKAGATFPNLLDPKGDFFAKIAKDKKMPRTYLLDAGGGILWFDVERSNSTRRNLVQGIRATLEKP